MHPESLLLVSVAGLWGLAAGALVPRVVYRLAVEADSAGEGWRDRCPVGHLIGGWIGPARCGACAGGTVPADAGRPAVRGGAGSLGTLDPRTGRDPALYGPSTPLVAMVTAAVCLLLALATGPRPELAVWLLLAPAGVLLATVDFKVQRLPDVVTLPLAAAALALLGPAALAPDHSGRWTGTLLGALALGALYFVLFLVNPNGMGFGDVKLAVGIGAVLGWYGWPVTVLGTLAGFLLGALYALALVLTRHAGRGTSMPFGPFLLAGALAGVLLGAYGA